MVPPGRVLIDLSPRRGYLAAVDRQSTAAPGGAHAHEPARPRQIREAR